MNPLALITPWLIAGVAASLTLSIGGLWAARQFVVGLPADYFAGQRAGAEWRHRHPVVRWLWFAVKNLLGLALIAAGIAMLVAPGPGVLTILVGVCLVSVPGKQALIRRLLGNRRVLAAMNAMRWRAGAPPLTPPRSESIVDSQDG
jgi:hypothetical protein